MLGESAIYRTKMALAREKLFVRHCGQLNAVPIEFGVKLTSQRVRTHEHFVRSHPGGSHFTRIKRPSKRKTIVRDCGQFTFRP